MRSNTRVRRQPDAQIQVAGLARRRFHVRLRRRRGRASRRRRPAGMRTSTVRACAVVRHGQPARRAVVGVLEPQLDLLLDVAARRAGRAPGRRAAARVAGPGPAALAPPKNVWKKSENGSASPNISRISSSVIVRKPPGRPGCRASARGRRHPPSGAGLLVHPPVGAELVVFLALLRIAEDLVGLVDLLEARLGRLVARD